MNSEFLLDYLQSLANEKAIDKDKITEYLQNAIIKLYKREYDSDINIVVNLDEVDKTFSFYYFLTCVDLVVDDFTQITLADAKLINPDITIGDTVKKEMKISEISRMWTSSIGYAFKKSIMEYEKELIYQKYISKKGTIISGIVIERTHTNIFVELPGTIGFVPRVEQIPREILKLGHKVKFYILDVVKDNLIGQVLLSRTNSRFLKLLLEIEIPEVSNNIITIKNIVRCPGIRSKIVVSSNDPNINPVGSCIGKRGERIKIVNNEFAEEKIDIVVWDEDPFKYVINCFLPVKIISLDLNQDQTIADVVIPDDQSNIVFGRSGVFLKLVSKITNLKAFNVKTYSKALECNFDIKWNGNLTKEELKTRLDRAPYTTNFYK